MYFKKGAVKPAPFFYLILSPHSPIIKKIACSLWHILKT